MLAMSPYETFQDGFIFTVKTDNPGTSNGNQFTLPLITGTYDYTVNWGDGVAESFAINANQTHTYSSAGNYTIRISGKFPGIAFSNTGDKLKVISIQSLGDVGWSDLNGVFQGCSNVTDFVRGGDLSQATFAPSAFRDMTGLTQFPKIDLDGVLNFSFSWLGCISLISFPYLNIGLGTRYRGAWLNCFSLVDFPPNMFDNLGEPLIFCFYDTWRNCGSLSAQSVENILVSIDSSGRNAPTEINEGDKYISIDYNVATGALSAATNTAITNLKNKGWAPFINGVLV